MGKKKPRYSPLEKMARDTRKRVNRLECMVDGIDWPAVRAVAPSDYPNGMTPSRSRRNRSGRHTDDLVADRHDVGYR